MPGSINDPPESGWQLRGFLGYYEVDLQVSCKDVPKASCELEFRLNFAQDPEPYSLISVANLPPGRFCSCSCAKVL